MLVFGSIERQTVQIIFTMAGAGSYANVLIVDQVFRIRILPKDLKRVP